MKKNKWPTAIAAVIMLAITWTDTDTGALKKLNADVILPVMIITLVIFLLKTGILSAILMGTKKLWEQLRK